MTDQFTVPGAVLANICRRWPEAADPWATHVEDQFRAICERYRAVPRAMLSARYGFVVAVDTNDGPLVIRSSPDPHGSDQAAVATALADLGAAPRVYEAFTTKQGTWTVLERVLPGMPLSQADPATVNLPALFEPLAAMADQPAPRPNMPSIFDWLRGRLEDDHLTDLRPGTSVASIGEREIALALLDDLVRDHRPALCHGDASSGNIISSGSRDWKYIDPRGMSGDYAYDVAVLATRIRDVGALPNLLHKISKLADVDAHELTAWMTVADASRV